MSHCGNTETSENEMLGPSATHLMIVGHKILSIIRKMSQKYTKFEKSCSPCKPNIKTNKDKQKKFWLHSLN